MNILNNTFQKLWCPILVLVLAIVLSSCNKVKLEIEQNFPFEVEVMPVPKDIANGNTIEIRFRIISSGDFTETEYFLRYFQFDGVGELRNFNESPYQPNDLYPLSEKQFRLYYTSRSVVAQSFDIWVSDNFGNEQQLNFKFNNKD